MSAQVLPFRRTLTVLGHFGGCPVCGLEDGFLNIESEHWFVCHRHGVKWFVGSNLFSSWEWDTDTDKAESARALAGYREVEPLPCTSPGPDDIFTTPGDAA